MEQHGAHHRPQVTPALADLETAIELVESNYAGYRDALELVGADGTRAAADRARKLAAVAGAAGDAQDASDALRAYLAAFRDPHLTLHDLTGADAARDAPARAERQPSLPEARRIAPDLFLIRVPTFDLRARPTLDALVREHDDDIRGSEMLILDVRGNSGGSDETYACLLPCLYGARVEVPGVEFLASPGNIAAWERIVAMIPPAETAVLESVERVVAAMRGHPGEFVSLEPSVTWEMPDVWAKPSRVAIWIDERCASATEQLLLWARAGGRATLFGRPTRGCLDHTNPLPFDLPSGRWQLHIPCCRSLRLPQARVDGIGILPDIEIPAAAGDEQWIDAVRRHFALRPAAGHA
jgi:hypothetical protein